MWNCRFDFNVQVLNGIKSVTLGACNKLTSLHGLGGVNDHVCIQGCANILDFSPLSKIRSVEITDIKSCSIQLGDVSHIQHLKVVRCDKFLSLRGLENIQTIEIQGTDLDCSSLTRGGNEKLVIYYGSNQVHDFEQFYQIYLEAEKTGNKKVFLKKNSFKNAFTITSTTQNSKDT
jgi:hypothetical protein